MHYFLAALGTNTESIGTCVSRSAHSASADALLLAKATFTAVILLIIVSSVATPLALKTLFAKHPSDHPSAVAVNESGKA